MAIVYHVYTNDGAGGPVDYTTLYFIATGLTFATPALAVNSDNTFAVRTFDTVTGLEDQNTDCRCRIVVGPIGQDFTGIPNAPLGLTARVGPGGTVRVDWHYSPGGQAAPPSHFRVWLTAGTVVNYAAPVAASIPYTPGLSGYLATLTGLADATVYAIGVRARGSAATDETNTNIVLVTGDTTGPAPITNLTGSPTY